jgi:hypothetical protein
MSLTVRVLWRTTGSSQKPERAVLSEETVLRIHEMASHQPYPMPPDGGGGGTFSGLPFDQNHKKSLFIFWLFFLAIAGAAAYYLSPFWLDVVSRHVTDQHSRLSWALTFVLSAVLANMSDRFLQFVFFLVPPIRSFIQGATWMLVTLYLKPATTAHSAYGQVMKMANRLSHWCFGIPLPLLLPARVDRSTTLMANAVSVVSGYHLINSRIARNYMLILKSLVQEPLHLRHAYFALRDAPIFPTIYFQSWTWWAMNHILRFILGELSWRSISWLKLFVRHSYFVSRILPKLTPLKVLLAPTAIIWSYSIYKYNRVVRPLRSLDALPLD